jgi:stage II sporulation protein D
MFSWGAFSAKTWGGESTRLVNVGLATNQTEIGLPLNGSETILDLSSSPAQTVFQPGDQETVTCSGDELFVNDIPVGTGPLLVISEANLLTWGSRSYRGMFLIMAQKGKLQLINRLELEEYLQGVVPREVSPSWAAAALKAQAIAARTYTYTSLKRHQDAGFDLCATDHCQVYGGATAEYPSTNKAVMETKGQVLTYKGKIIGAFYHSSSGGFTEDAANVWGESSQYLKPVIDWDQNSPYTCWTRTLSWPDLQGLTAGAYPRIGRLKQLLPTAFGKDGRILRLTLKGDLGEVSLSGNQFRGITGIPSSNMRFLMVYGPEPFITLDWINHQQFPEVLVPSDIPGLTAEILNPPWDQPDPWAWLADKEPVKLVIRGAGWGHGVGLSQWGAKGMADFGYNEYQILAHYYPGSVITPIDKLK